MRGSTTAWDAAAGMAAPTSVHDHPGQVVDNMAFALSGMMGGCDEPQQGRHPAGLSCLRMFGPLQGQSPGHAVRRPGQWDSVQGGVGFKTP